MRITVCPRCHAALTEESDALRCHTCGARYPVADHIADFSDGHYFDAYDERIAPGPEEREWLAAELEGTRMRIERYYGPRIPRAARVLDCGCGSGISVDLLMDRGLDAWGVDLSIFRRKTQWPQRRHPDRLALASALRLPFADASFDVVIASGLIEHIGVAESGGLSYSVTPLPERDAQRKAFMDEMLRVVRPRGTVFIDCPNGAFPIDFWHGTTSGKARWHKRSEGFLPSFQEIRRMAKEADRNVTVRALSPHGRFAFRQVGRHWYRVFTPLVGALFYFFRLPLLGRGLARTALNPYLVVEISKS